MRADVIRRAAPTGTRCTIVLAGPETLVAIVAGHHDGFMAVGDDGLARRFIDYADVLHVTSPPSLNLADQIAAAVDAVDWGKPTARKSGRDNRWPYVPIIDHTEREKRPRTEQIRGKAFATRKAAIEYAESCIVARRALLAGQLAEPRYRVLREAHGLPREIPSSA